MLQVAKSKRVVTPEGSVPIAGHAMRTSPSTGVHDQLETHVLLLDLEGTKCCFINADLIGVSFEFADRVKEAVERELGIARDYTVFSVTHTHTGPYFGMASHTEEMSEADIAYENYVFDQTMEAVREAAGQFVPFETVKVRRGEVKGFYGNRNSLDKPGDEMVTLLEFRQGDKVVAAMVNISCHSTVMNPLETNLSADLLGNVRRELTPYLEVEPLMTNGNAGDISNRLYRHNNDFGELKRVTSGIAAHIAGFKEVGELSLTPVQSAHRVPFQVEYDTDKAGLQEALEKLEGQLETVTEFDARKWLHSEIAGYKRKLNVDHVSIRLDSTVLRLGELELVILPCELASAFGRQIKRSSNAKLCLVWGYANGQSTYVVEASEFNGGHDGISTQLKRGQAEEYVGKLIQGLF